MDELIGAESAAADSLTEKVVVVPLQNLLNEQLKKLKLSAFQISTGFSFLVL
jgi:hypothetical protein